MEEVVVGKHVSSSPLLLAGILLTALAAGVPVATAAPAATRSTVGSQERAGCTFQSLSPEDQARYRSRYQRRVRVDGQAYADRWLREEACPTQQETRARKRSADGRNCRAVSRPVTSMDGSMTVGIGRKCD